MQALFRDCEECRFDTVVLDKWLENMVFCNEMPLFDTVDGDDDDSAVEMTDFKFLSIKLDLKLVAISDFDGVYEFINH